jgi:hypothetical protein
MKEADFYEICENSAFLRRCLTEIAFTSYFIGVHSELKYAKKGGPDPPKARVPPLSFIIYGGPFWVLVYPSELKEAYFEFISYP